MQRLGILFKRQFYRSENSISAACYGAIIGKPNYSGIGYTGHVMDGATGLTYMQQRYYDQSVGRFLSVDPVTAQYTKNNFNRYAYAFNNPYRFVDPDGRDGMETIAETMLWAEPGYSQKQSDASNGFGQAALWIPVNLLICGGCDTNYVAPIGSGAVQPITSPVENILLARGFRGTPKVGGTGMNNSRVGRWMSPAEYQAMKASGVVQTDVAGMPRVAFPANKNAYKAAPKGDIYVEYDLPTSSLSPGGTAA